MRSFAAASIVLLLAGSATLWCEARQAGAAEPGSGADYARAVADAQAKCTAASTAARTELEKQLSAAKATLDAATREATAAYVKKLEADLERETKAGHEEAAATIRRQIDYVVNGPPRSESQKLWAESFAAEANKNFEASLAAMEKLILVANVEKNAYVQMRLGWLHYLDADYLEAVAAYNQSISLAPGAITPRLGLLNCYLALNRTDDAIEGANAILKIDPLNFRANKVLGDAYYLREDYVRASSYYSRLSIAYPDDLQIATDVAWSYLKMNETDVALQMFINVLAVQPDNVAALEGVYAASPSKGAVAKGTETSEEAAKDKIVIRNPAAAAAAVNYTLNGQYPVKLEPGTSQTLDLSRTWIIRFEPSKGQPSDERLKAGIYEFRQDNDSLKLSRK